MADLSEVGVFLLTEEEEEQEENTTVVGTVEELNDDNEFTFVYDEEGLPIPTNMEAREQFERENNKDEYIDQLKREVKISELKESDDSMALSPAEYIEKKQQENDTKAKLKKAAEEKAKKDFQQKELHKKHQKKMLADMERDEEIKMAENRRLMAEAKKKNAKKKLESFLDFAMND